MSSPYANNIQIRAEVDQILRQADAMAHVIIDVFLEQRAAQK